MNWIHEVCLFLDGMHKLSLFSCALCAHLLTGRRLFLIMFHSQVDIWFVCGLIASSTRECTEGHSVTFFDKQIGCLHIKSEREKGKNVLWTSVDAAESTLWEKCLLLRKDWTLKYSTTNGVMWNWPYLLVSLSKHQHVGSVFHVFFKVPLDFHYGINNKSCCFLFPSINKQHKSELISTLNNTNQKDQWTSLKLFREDG